MPFLLCTFGNNGVAVVPESWVSNSLDENMDCIEVCSWPPNKSNRSKLVSNETPPSKDWKQIPVLSSEPFENLEAAVAKLKEVSEEDEEEEKNVSLYGRLRKPNRRYVNEDSADGGSENSDGSKGDSDGSEGDSYGSKGEPQKKKKKKEKEPPKSKKKIAENSQNKKTASGKKQMAPAPALSLPLGTPPPSAKTAPPPPSPPSGTDPQETQVTPGSSKSTHRTRPDDRTTPGNDISLRRKFIDESLLRQNLELKQGLKGLEEKIDALTGKQFGRSTQDEDQRREILKKLPLADYTQVEALENELKTKEKADVLKEHLDRVGNGSVTYVTTHLLSRLFTDELATKLNLFCATKEKKSISKLDIFRIFMDAVLKSTTGNEQEITRVAQNWFRNAKDRLERRRKKSA